jgi:hypothetical protein
MKGLTIEEMEKALIDVNYPVKGLSDSAIKFYYNQLNDNSYMNKAIDRVADLMLAGGY